MPATGAVDDVHLRHELLVRQVRKTTPDLRVVKRQELETIPAVPFPQTIHLRGTEATLTVEDDYVSPVGRISQSQARLPSHFRPNEVVYKSGGANLPGAQILAEGCRGNLNEYQRAVFIFYPPNLITLILCPPRGLTCMAGGGVID